MSQPSYIVQTKIRRPIAEVFDAIVDPAQLQSYFVDRSDGPLVPGQTVTWHWNNWGDYPVRVIRADRPLRIELELDSTVWRKTADHGYKVLVRMDLEAVDAASTLLKVSETGWRTDALGLKASHENCSGWTHMTLCLKSYLEHGIKLRDE